MPASPTTSSRSRPTWTLQSTYVRPRRAGPTRSIRATASSRKPAMQAGLVGPTADALRRGGDKLGAKEIARRAAVPVRPGGRSARDRVPADGQGGRGRRRPRDARRPRAGELRQALAAARREARAGSATTAPGRALRRARPARRDSDPRRSAGNVLHLGERECSPPAAPPEGLEETPSPVVAPELRREWLGAAGDPRAGDGYVECRHRRVPRLRDESRLVSSRSTRGCRWSIR